ncbi:MAG TPA: hypothetical protein VN456_05585 [Desulfosporosinus sp.]|nr:hypothetical protein [Desulfosporosinus sp.]
MNSLQEEENTVWQAIVKYGIADGFWNLTEKYYGYFAPEKSLKEWILVLYNSASLISEVLGISKATFIS